MNSHLEATNLEKVDILNKVHAVIPSKVLTATPHVPNRSIVRMDTTVEKELQQIVQSCVLDVPNKAVVKEEPMKDQMPVGIESTSRWEMVMFLDVNRRIRCGSWRRNMQIIYTS